MYNNGMFNIDSEVDGIAFCLIEGMYNTESGIGYGCQVNDETKRENIEKMCFDIYKTVKSYEEIK